MPIFIYRNPETDETIEVIQSVHEDHIYKDENGLMWKRVFTVPNASIDARLDAYSKADWIKYTDNKRGKLKDLQEKSAELSAIRAAKDGKDPVRERWFDNYAKERKGLEHPLRKQQQAKEKLASRFNVEF